jgi:hypothetical protein
MTEYALLINDVFKEIRNYESKPENIPHKGVTWHNVVREYGNIEFTGIENDDWIVRTIDPSTLPPPVPLSVSPRQVRLLLLQQDLLDEVETLITTQPREIQIAWEYALEFQRNDPLLNTLAQNLNLTEQELDSFFIAAANL